MVMDRNFVPDMYRDDVFLPGIYVYDLQEVKEMFDDIYDNSDLHDPYVISQIADNVRMMSQIHFSECENLDAKTDMFRSVAKCVQKIKDQYDPEHAEHYSQISGLGKGEVFDRNVAHMCHLFLCRDFDIATSLDGIAESLAEKNHDVDAYYQFLDDRGRIGAMLEYNNAHKTTDDNIIRHNVLSEEGYPDDYPDEKLPSYLADKVYGHPYHEEKKTAKIPEDENAELREFLDSYKYKVKMIGESDKSHLNVMPDFDTYDDACVYIMDRKGEIIRSAQDCDGVSFFGERDGKLFADISFSGKPQDVGVHYEFSLLDGYNNVMDITWDVVERSAERAKMLGSD